MILQSPIQNFDSNIIYTVLDERQRGMGKGGGNEFLSGSYYNEILFRLAFR